MFCPYCGEEASEEHRFCMKCGKAFPSKPPAEEPEERFCDLCLTELSPEKTALVSAAEMRTIALNGFGGEIALWKELTTVDRQKKFRQLTLVNNTPWAICEVCRAKTRPFSGKPDEVASNELFRDAAIKPILDALNRQGKDKSAASPSPPAPKSPAEQPPFRRSTPVRVFYALLGAALLFFAIGFLSDAYRVISLPHWSDLAHRTTWETIVAADNGMNLSIGLFLVALALLTINSAFMGQRRTGPVDWLMSLASSHTAIPIFVLLVALVLLVKGWFFETYYYRDAEAAATAFAKPEMKEPTNTGDLLFAIDEGGYTHMAKITPELVRAFDRHSVRINPYEQNKHEPPLPGVLPILFLFAVWTYTVIPLFRQRVRNNATSRMILIVGLIGFYVIWWCASGNRGIFWEDGDLHPEWVVGSIILTIAALTFLMILYAKLRDPLVAAGVKDGWISIFFLANLGATAGIHWVSFSSPGHPIWLWLPAYLVPASLCWLISSEVLKDEGKGS